MDRDGQPVPLHFGDDPLNGSREIIAVPENSRTQIGHELPCERQSLVHVRSDLLEGLKRRLRLLFQTRQLYLAEGQHLRKVVMQFGGNALPFPFFGPPQFRGERSQLLLVGEQGLSSSLHALFKRFIDLLQRELSLPALGNLILSSAVGFG